LLLYRSLNRGRKALEFDFRISSEGGSPKKCEQQNNLHRKDSPEEDSAL